jgi:hypothetical protein
MKKLLILFLISGSAHAATQISWTLPTTNTDGSSIPASGTGSLTSSRVEYGTCSGSSFGTKISEIVVGVPATNAVIEDLAAGTYCFRVFAKNTYGTESGPSAVVSKTIATPVPNPPTLVTVSTVAYDYIKKGNRFVLGKPVGTVPLGTACGSFVIKNKGTSYYEVSNVTFTGTTRSAPIAICS